jgi:hypothetical protein
MIAAALVALLAMPGCGGFAGDPGRRTSAAFGLPVEPVRRMAPDQMPNQVVFADLAVFDDDLSSRLRGGPEMLVVAFAGPTSINQMPPRVDRWLSAVHAGGGAVEATPVSPDGIRTRGVVSAAIDLVGRLVGAVREQTLYAPAAAYDAEVLYVPGTGQVREIRFTRR